MLDAVFLVTIVLVVAFFFIIVVNFQELFEMFKEIFHKHLK